MMKPIIVVFALFFGLVLSAQENPLPSDEYKRLTKFEGIQVAFQYNDPLKSYIYSTQMIQQASTNVTNPQVKMKAYIKLKVVDDTYCFSDIYFGFTLYRQGKGIQYDSIGVAIGFPSNISRGDAQMFGFTTESDAEGNGHIGGDQIEEIISISSEKRRPITFYFYNKANQVGEFMVPYAKVGQKITGIVKTRDNLAQKYVICEGDGR